MNCLHYPVPGIDAIRRAASHLPGAPLRRRAGLWSNDHLSCHALLSEISRRLEDTKLDDGTKADLTRTVDAITGELARDQRVRRNLGEYYEIRFLQAEARSALAEHSQTPSDGSGFPRLGSKLRRDLAHHREGSHETVPAISLEVTGAPASRPAVSVRQVIADLGRVAGFLVLLTALVAGVLATGMMVIGVGH